MQLVETKTEVDDDNNVFHIYLPFVSSKPLPHKLYLPPISDISSSETEFGLSEESDTTSFGSPHSSSSEDILEHGMFADKYEDDIASDVE